MIITDETQLEQVIQLLSKSLYWTYDLETTGLNPRKDKIIGFGGCNPQNLSEKFYIITHKYQNERLIETIKRSSLAPVLDLLAKKRLIMHNASFDTRFTIHNYGYNYMNALYCDTMILAHTTDENKFSYALKTLATELFGDTEKDAQKEMLASIKTNGGLDKEYYKADSYLLAKYALKDVEQTAKLYNHYNPILKRKGLWDFFYNDEVMPLLKNVTINMELKGIPVDVPFLERTKLEIDADLSRIESEIQTEIEPLLTDFNQWYMNKQYPPALSGEFLNTVASIVAPQDWPQTKAGGYSFALPSFKKKQHLLEHDLWLYKNNKKRMPKDLILQAQKKLHISSGQLYAFNILSKDHLKRLFFEKLNETPLSTTELGNPQVTDDFLEQMAEKYTWASKLRTYNKLTKINGTYVSGILEKQDNGIFYPNFFQHKTVSGRYGSNIQQLPRPIEEGKAEPLVTEYTNRIRKFFIAGPGYKFVDDDYESLEPHVFAHVSNDDGLRDIFRKGHDFYSTIAIATEGLHEYSADKKAPNYLGKMNKAARQKSKEYCLGIPYGKGSYALGLSLGIPEEEAAKLVKGYLDAYPNLKKWMSDSVQFVKQNGYIKTEAGRIRSFPELSPLLKKYGDLDMTNALEIWKEYHETHNTYQKAKSDSRIIKNCYNNAKNIQIQGLGASIVNRACIALAAQLSALPGNNYICAQIHDEVIVRCEKKNVDLVCKMVQDCLENTYKISLSLKAVPSIGDNFAEAKG